MKLVFIYFLVHTLASGLLFSDIYVSCVSTTHNVTAKGFFLVLVATTVETSTPESELQPGLELLGAIKEK